MKKTIKIIGVCVLGYGVMTALGYLGGTLVGKAVVNIMEGD